MAPFASRRFYMATVLHRTTKELRRSVNTPDFPVGQWIINPNLSAVGSFPSKYWIITGDVVTLMNPPARNAVDAQEAADVLAEDRAANKLRIDNERVLKAFALTVLDEINILRGQHGLAARTQTQLINAIKTRVEVI